MQDPRLRLFATVILSVAAFASAIGAVAALAWWLLFTPRTKALRGPACFLLIAMIAMLRSSLNGERPWCLLPGQDGRDPAPRCMGIYRDRRKSLPWQSGRSATGSGSE